MEKKSTTKQVFLCWNRSKQKVIFPRANNSWGYKFGTGGSSKNPCAEDFQGPKAFSSQEASSMARYIKSRGGKVISYIDFHAYSQLWMYPFGYDCYIDAPDKEKLDKSSKAAVQALKSVNGVSFAQGPICEIIYQASGSSVDWTYAIGKVTYSMAVELRDKGRYGFLLPPDQIIPSGKETLAALSAFVMKIKEIEGY